MPGALGSELVPALTPTRKQPLRFSVRSRTGPRQTGRGGVEGGGRRPISEGNLSSLVLTTSRLHPGSVQRGIPYEPLFRFGSQSSQTVVITLRGLVPIFRKFSFKPVTFGAEECSLWEQLFWAGSFPS